MKLKTQTVEVQITYTVSGKKTYTFPEATSLTDMQAAIEMQLENEGLLEDATGFKCTYREYDADIIRLERK